VRLVTDRPRMLGRVACDERQVLRSHIRALPRFLGERVVETVVGRGTRFLVDVLELGRFPAEGADA